MAVRPLRDGVISDYEMTEKMLEQFLKKISKFSLIKPRVIVSVPSGVTEVEDIHYIERGYENFVGKLKALGADIEIVDFQDDNDGAEKIISVC